MNDQGAIKLGIDALKEIQKSRGVTIDKAIDKAIETLNDPEPDIDGILNDDYKNAVKLGIEALAFIKQHRSVLDTMYTTFLPGETKD